MQSPQSGLFSLHLGLHLHKTRTRQLNLISMSLAPEPDLIVEYVWLVEIQEPAYLLYLLYKACVLVHNIDEQISNGEQMLIRS